MKDDGVPFKEKMAELTKTRYGQMEGSERLGAVIKENLRGLGYGEYASGSSLFHV